MKVHEIFSKISFSHKENFIKIIPPILPLFLLYLSENNKYFLKNIFTQNTKQQKRKPIALTNW